MSYSAVAAPGWMRLMARSMTRTSAVKGVSLVHDFAELEERQAVDRPQDGVGEAPRRLQFQILIVARAQAGVDGHHDRQRQLRLAMEDRDLLRLAVLEDLKVFLLQRRNRSTAGVGDGGEDVHQLDVDLEGCVRLFVAVVGGRRRRLLLRVRRMRHGVGGRPRRIGRMRNAALRAGAGGAADQARQQDQGQKRDFPPAMNADRAREQHLHK